MAQRCPGCNKFASVTTDQEPEISLDLETSLETSQDEGKTLGHVYGSIRVVLVSECCSEELKEYTFDVDIGDLELERNGALDPACTCEGEDWLKNAQIQGESGDTIEKRSRPALYQVDVKFDVVCGCGKKIGQGEYVDEVAGSDMDELT